MAAGNDFFVGLKNDGSLWAWGSNDQGQLGDGTNVSRLKPGEIGHDKDRVAVTAGERHSLGLKREGTVWEWGMVRPPPENKLMHWFRVSLAKASIKLPAFVNLRPMKTFEARPEKSKP